MKKKKNKKQPPIVANGANLPVERIEDGIKAGLQRIVEDQRIRPHIDEISVDLSAKGFQVDRSGAIYAKGISLSIHLALKDL